MRKVEQHSGYCTAGKCDKRRAVQKRATLVIQKRDGGQDCGLESSVGKVAVSV